MVADRRGSLPARWNAVAFDFRGGTRSAEGSVPDHTASVGISRIGRDRGRGVAPPAQMTEITLLASLLEGATRSPDRTAAALVSEFGTAGAALAGSARRQRRAWDEEGVARRLAAVRDAVQAVTRARVRSRPVLSSMALVVDYLCAHMRFEELEQVRVLFLDPRRALISDDVLWTGIADEAPLYVGRLFHRALDLSASGIIVAHNHPSGDPTPSAFDLKVTRRIADAGRTLDITLIDHLIVGRNDVVSMRALGAL